MVVPWIGFPLGTLLKKFQPTLRAKYVEFTTLHDPEIMTGQQSNSVLTWPYTEGLHIDEAMNPLTFWQPVCMMSNCLSRMVLP